MDNKKFALDAFAQAQQASIEMEAEYFNDYVQRMGLEDAMHLYEKALICKAFHAGCQAGQMMGGTK